MHIFMPDPKDAWPDDEAYPNRVLAKQIAFFGPFPPNYFDFLPKEDARWEIIGDGMIAGFARSPTSLRG